MKASVRVILVRPRNPQNIGACARAMANFGFSDLAVVDPYEPVWKETRSAPGAESLVLKARKFSSIAQATRGFRILLATSSFHQRSSEQARVDLPAWPDFFKKLPAGRIAILFGSERSGLSNEELAACRAVIRIPTNTRTPSMNLAQAVAVVLYELNRIPSPVRHYTDGGRPPTTQWRAGEGGRRPGEGQRREERHPLPNPPPRRGREFDAETLIRSWIDLAGAANYPPGYTSAARAGRIRQVTKNLEVPAHAQQFLLSFSRWLRKKLS